MAITLVNANTVAGATLGGTSLTPTCVSTTQHNLLVCWIGFGGTSAPTGVTFPSGWSSAISATLPGTTDATTYIWYYPDCPAAITSVAITWTGTEHSGAQILEFAGCATASPLDRTGTVTGTGTSLVCATSLTTTAANELAVAAATWEYGSAGATKVTLTTGAGFTNAGNFNNGLKTVGHNLGDYDLDTGASGSTPSDTIAGAAAGADSAAGVIATFKGGNVSADVTGVGAPVSVVGGIGVAAGKVMAGKPLVIGQAVKRGAFY